MAVRACLGWMDNKLLEKKKSGVLLVVIDGSLSLAHDLLTTGSLYQLTLEQLTRHN